MPTALIADDEPLMREMLREELGMLWPDLEIIAEAVDGRAALRDINALSPDVAFLDIQMPELTGLQVADAITVPTRVVFVTAYDHALEAFKLNAVHYVLKPIERANIKEAISRLQRVIASRSELLIAQERFERLSPESPASEPTTHINIELSDTRLAMIDVDDILYIESDERVTLVTTRTETGKIGKSLKSLVDELDARWFVRTHRSYIVNRRHIRTIHKLGPRKMELELRDCKERITVSEDFQKLFKKD